MPSFDSLSASFVASSVGGSRKRSSCRSGSTVSVDCRRSIAASSASRTLPFRSSSVRNSGRRTRCFAKSELPGGSSETSTAGEEHSRDLSPSERLSGRRSASEAKPVAVGVFSQAPVVVLVWKIFTVNFYTTFKKVIRTSWLPEPVSNSSPVPPS